MNYSLIVYALFLVGTTHAELIPLESSKNATDVAEMGEDTTVISKEHINWFDVNDSFLLIVIGLALVLVVFIFILVLTLLNFAVRVVKSKRKRFPPLLPNPTDLPVEYQNQSNHARHVNFRYLADELHRSESKKWKAETTPLDQNIDKLPYTKSKYEIPFENMKIGKYLDSGCFGVVLSGYLTKPATDGIFSTDRLPVAIKTPKNSLDLTQVQMLSEELKIWCAIGKHPNVVALVGAVTRDMQYGQLYVIIEMCENGSLCDYIKLMKKRDAFLNRIQKHTTVGDNYYESRNSQRYVRCNIPQKSHQVISTTDLNNYAYQIANGMEYISRIPCVHRDLAARNVLLTKNNICKISDFGLARRYGFKDYYRQKKNKSQKLPIRWLSMEAISEGKYSEDSDVWAFGCVLYELYTLGEVPYSDIPSEELRQHILEGGKNKKPRFCHDDLYNLMMLCWDDQPDNRPSFSNCVYHIKKHIEQHSSEELEQMETFLKIEADKQMELDSWLDSMRRESHDHPNGSPELPESIC